MCVMLTFLTVTVVCNVVTVFHCDSCVPIWIICGVCQFVFALRDLELRPSIFQMFLLQR